MATTASPSTPLPRTSTRSARTRRSVSGEWEPCAATSAWATARGPTVSSWNCWRTTLSTNGPASRWPFRALSGRGMGLPCPAGRDGAAHRGRHSPSMSAPTPAVTRPMGITVLAVLSAIGGVLGILSGVALVGLGGFAAAATGTAGLFGLAAVFGVVAVVTGIANLAFAYGAWTLKPWAWPLGVALAIISIGLSVATIAGGGDITGQILPIAIAAIILYYLFQANIKALFGRA